MVISNTDCSASTQLYIQTCKNDIWEKSQSRLGVMSRCEMSIPCFFSFQMYSPFRFLTLSVFSHVCTVESILLFSNVVKTWTKREINRKKSMREKARERESSLHQIYPSFPSFSAVPAQILHCWQWKSRRGPVVCVLVCIFFLTSMNMCVRTYCVCVKESFFLDR